MSTTSQNSWPAFSDWGQDGSITATVPGASVNIQGGLRAGDSATVLLAWAAWFNTNVEPLNEKACWGIDIRPIRGSTTTSNHQSGTAIDLNADRHPLNSQPEDNYSAGQIARIRGKLTEFDHVLRWGGDYSGRKDPMHFEVNCPPDDPRVARLADRIRGGSAPPAPAPSHPTSSVPSGGALFAYPGHLLKSGDKGLDSIKRLQQALNLRGAHLVADGAFGPATLAAVKAFQSARGLAVDGLVGPATWGALSNEGASK